MGRKRAGAEFLANAERWATLGQAPVDIARNENLNRRRVANGIRVARNLIDEGKRRLRDDELTASRAIALARKTKTEQRTELDHAPSGAGSRFMPISAIRLLREAVRKSTKSSDWKAGALAALGCVLNEETISGIWPPARVRRRR
jgi:hypothetical protein